MGTLFLGTPTPVMEAPILLQSEYFQLKLIYKLQLKSLIYDELFDSLVASETLVTGNMTFLVYL